jgi:hypothetical protein
MGLLCCMGGFLIVHSTSLSRGVGVQVRVCDIAQGVCECCPSLVAVAVPRDSKDGATEDLNPECCWANYRCS